MSYIVYFLLSLFLIAFIYVITMYSYSYVYDFLNSTFIEQMGWTVPSTIKSQLNVLNTIVWGFIYVLLAIAIFNFLYKAWIASKSERWKY